MVNKNKRLGEALLFSAVLLSSVILASPNYGSVSQAQESPSTDDEFMIELNLSPSTVERGLASYDLGYVQIVSNATMEPTLAPRDLEIELSSRNPNIASVPAKVVISKGTDYARFTVGLSDLAGESEISALFGNQIITKTMKVVEAGSQIPNDISLVLNMPSNKMQIGSEMPFSVYLENNGEIMQAPQNVTVIFDYDRSLIKLSSNSATILKGDYYALATVTSLEKSGNAFIRAATGTGSLDAVSTIQISQTQPAALKLYIFPDKVGLNEKNVDVFVGLVDSAGNPTVASSDVNLELFASSSGVINIGENVMIKKGEYGMYKRQSILFFAQQNVTIGATSPGLGVSTDNFEVVERPLLSNSAKAKDKMLSIFTVPIGMPSDATSIVVYQLNAVEDDSDDSSDSNGDGEFTEADSHPIDELDEGELYPVQSGLLYSTNQGNLNVVTTDLVSLRVVDPGSITAGSSYGTAIVESGRHPRPVDVSVSLSNTASNTNSLTITGSLTPVQTMIFSPAGIGSDERYRIHFNQRGTADIFVITLDSEERPARAETGVQYLVKPMNELTDVAPEATFASLEIRSNQFSSVAQTTEISAIPVGVNSDPLLQTETTFNTVFFSTITGQVMFPFDSVIGFSTAHPIGTVQLRDQFGNPLLASEDITMSLSSSRAGAIASPTVTIPKGKSFANFEVLTSGKSESLSISAYSNGVRSTSSDLVSVLADLPGSFVPSQALIATQEATVTVQTDEGTSVLWGFPSSIQVISKEDKAATPGAGGAYSASAKIVASKPGSYVIDVTLLKDGFKPTRISNSALFESYSEPLNVVLFHNSPSIEYGKPVTMNIRVVDSASKPVPGAQVRLNPGPNATAVPSEGTTDSLGILTFTYTPTGAETKGVVTATAEKAGYGMGFKSTNFDVENVPTMIPPWIIFGIIGAVGAAAGGGGMYFMKKPKIERAPRRRSRKQPDNEESAV